MKDANSDISDGTERTDRSAHNEKRGKLREKAEELRHGSMLMKSKLLNDFTEKSEFFRNKFSEASLLDKLKRSGKKAGVNVVYMVLVLYYALLGKDVKLKEKAKIVAALGYFIHPFDFIPDFVGVMGFTDDFGVLFYIFKKIRDNVNEEVHARARQKVCEWFGEENLSDFCKQM